MPKSNFNQFIEECEDFTGIETYKNANNKISFENAQPEPVSNSLEIECETKKQNNQNIIQNTRTKSKLDYLKSSNIFLSKNVNSHQNRFSMNSQFNNGNVASVNAFRKNNDNNNNNSNNVNVNMFKNGGTSKEEIVIASSSPSLSVQSCIEINNETFPSLAPPRKVVNDSSHNTNTSTSTVPKKFKNFKDAITASAPEPQPVVHSPTKQKQTRPLQEMHLFKTKLQLPTQLLVKRDSEMLAKTKKISRFYDNENDDDDDEYDDNSPNYTYNYKHKPIKKQYYHDDDSDD